MVDIETTDDLVRALNHGPEVRRAVRSVVSGIDATICPGRFEQS